VVEALVAPAGPYRLRLVRPGGIWRAPLPHGREATAWQRPDGRVCIRAPTDADVELAAFMLALADDTAEFHRRFARDRLLGPTVRALVGYRPTRLATVAHATLRAVCGQLIESGRARAIERSILRATGSNAPTRQQLGRFAPAQLCRHGLAPQRAATLIRLCRTLELEGLRGQPTKRVVARLCRERGIGPWSCGVIALEGLGRYDQPLVGDLGLIKLASSLAGRWVEPWETEELLAPYGEWRGLAGCFLLVGWARGLVSGACADNARLVRGRRRRAASWS
jgi:3-methyladenine DNA glycosylase/8-oxoguanine DNA glycosylase